MYTNPDSIGRIAREHHHDMIAANRQRQLQRQLPGRQHRPAPRTVKITRRLAGAMAKVRVATARP
jgi:hypothetical protein